MADLRYNVWKGWESRMISIKNLSVAFCGKQVVNNVTFDIKPHEIIGIVGESGSGKSVTALTIMGLLSANADITSGEVIFNDTVLMRSGEKPDESLLRSFRGNHMSMVFQEPMTSFNPTQKIGKQLSEALKINTSLKKDEIKDKVIECFKDVGLRDPEHVFDSYPHQLSGGMRQRAMIAMSVILEPELIIADEPTTALDVTVQSQIVKLLKKINQEHRTSILFITHDLNLAREICDRIIVMKDGVIRESGDAQEIFNHPEDSYTRMLIEKVPSRTKKKSNVQSIQTAKSEDEYILSVKNLNVFYDQGSNSLFTKSRKKKQVINDISFNIKRSEILGLVGESGCGKTTLSKAILGINTDYTGEISLNCNNRPQMIFQDPYSSLNPAKTIGWLLEEPLRALGARDHSKKMSGDELKQEAIDILKKVGLDETYYNRRPSQLSGGQRQRISIGQAVITKPELIVADEPVSALDVTIQAQIMELMLKLQEEMHLAYLFISHDINVVYQMSNRIMVMKEGRIIESGDTQEVFDNPKESYTKQLLLAESQY